MDEWTRRQIDKITVKTLREAGIVSPPVQVEDLLDHLHRTFGLFRPSGTRHWSGSDRRPLQRGCSLKRFATRGGGRRPARCGLIERAFAGRAPLTHLLLTTDYNPLIPARQRD